jgi:superfamily II DNA/RNA helicase
MMQCIKQAGFTVPSVIQAQSWPAALQNRDVVGVAKTGSGKTLGFLFPGTMIVMECNHTLRNKRFHNTAALYHTCMQCLLWLDARLGIARAR